ncbi:MAG: LD-carboxypeptidase [Burkholderiaceae bacterium]
METVAIFAPGGYDSDPQRLAQALRYFAARGDRALIRVDIEHSHERFSGTDAERLGWLHEVAADPSIGIAMALRGGYGATRLLPHIDFDALATAVRRERKRFVGHSDFTVIGCGLLATSGAVSFAGPMASYDFGGAVNRYTEAQFWRAMHEAAVDVAFDTPHTGRHRVEGTLWGGNLAMLCSLIGTPWMPAVDGGILFIEDINEQPYRIERMMLQLQQAGVLDRQEMILCGDFSGFRIAPYDNGYGIAEAMAYVQSTTRVPLVSGLPFGHCPAKATLAMGAVARVEVADGRVRLQQHWDLSAI